MTDKQKILIVDDRRENLVALRQVLREVDAEIVEAATGNEALAATLNHEFALAILDVQMPGMSGYELAEHLRGDKKTQMIPIVFLTAAYADEEHRFMGYEAGGVDYLTKPYSPEVIRAKVNVFLKIDRYRRDLEMLRNNLETRVLERTGQLNERIKELKCLYAISSLVAEPCESIYETLNAAVNLIPVGWQYPEITSARIIFEEREFATEGFRETLLKLSADIVVSGKKLGAVEVCYLEERPALDEGPFLKDERDQINDIARQLGVMISRKQAEAALQAMNEEIKTVSQQLLQAEKLATLGELASSIAHELNNPLATISLSVEMLISKTNEDDPSRRKLEIIGHEVERMGNLVSNLLQFSRRSQPQISTVNVCDEIEKTLELIIYQLRKRNIAVERKFEPGVTTIHADRQQLRQLFLNLFMNAGDAMPEGGNLTISVYKQGSGVGDQISGIGDQGSEAVDHGPGVRGQGSGVTQTPDPRSPTPDHKGKAFVVIEVADTGVGIPPEILSKVMEPFYTTKPEGKGTGLGLSICRRIVEGHGGTLGITSEGCPGKGIRVYINLPFSNSHNTESLNRNASAFPAACGGASEQIKNR